MTPRLGARSETRRRTATLFIAGTAAAVAAAGAQAARVDADSVRLLTARAEHAERQHSPESLLEALELYKRTATLLVRTGPPYEHARILGSIGRVYADLGVVDSAFAYYHHALARKRELGDSVAIPSNLNNLARLYQQVGQVDTARAYFGEALAFATALGDREGVNAVVNNLGMLFNARGERDSAGVYYTLALSLARDRKNHADEARALNNLAAVAQQVGEVDSAATLMRQALELWVTIHDRDGETSTLNNLGVVFGALGRADSGLVYLRRSLTISRQIADKDGEANTLLNIGLLHERLGRPDSALAAAGLAYEAARASSNVQLAAKALNAIGYVRLVRDEPDSARVFLRVALDFSRRIDDRPGEADALTNLASAYYQLHRIDSAATLLARAMDIMTDLHDGVGQATLMSAIATIGTDVGMADTAIADYRRALALARGAGGSMVERAILTNMAYTFHRNLTPPDLPSAIAYYDSAAALLASLGATAGGDVNRLSFAERDVDVFSMWALAWLARDGAVGTRSAALAALAAAERGRAQALLDLMRGRTTTVEPGADLVAEGERLMRVVRSSRAATVTYLMTPDTLIAWLLMPSGDVVVSRQTKGRASLARLIDRFHESLGNALADDRRMARALVARRGQRGLSPRGLSAAAYDAVADSLSEILLPDVIRERLPSSGDVVIVPSGMLSVIPFAALRVGRSGVPLGERNAIRYAPSLTMLAMVASRDTSSVGARRKAGGAALIVSNPTMPSFVDERGGIQILPQLTGADAEGNAVARRLGASVLTGRTATETEVRRRLAGASIVHLATHGLAYTSETRARDSFVALARDSKNDGLLRVGEVLDLRVSSLRADLIVLSACQTGLGDIKAAEGTVGLQRAFLAKGARSVLVSLWSVDDDATRVLMERFYQHWLDDRDDPDKAEALRRAQNDVRSSAEHPEWAHPRYWAAFQLVGAP